MSYATRYGGHIPEALNHFKPLSNSPMVVPLCEYANNCNLHRHFPREPLDYRGIGLPPPGRGPFEIYHRAKGVIPYYGGHVPGVNLQFGKTYGSCSVNARQWLRGEVPKC